MGQEEFARPSEREKLGKGEEPYEQFTHSLDDGNVSDIGASVNFPRVSEDKDIETRRGCDLEFLNDKSQQKKSSCKLRLLFSRLMRLLLLYIFTSHKPCI